MLTSLAEIQDEKTLAGVELPALVLDAESNHQRITFLDELRQPAKMLREDLRSYLEASE